MRCAGLAACILTLAGAQVAAAQGFGTISGTSGPNQILRIPVIGQSALRHQDKFGKPCIDVTAVADPERASPGVFKHVLHFDNHCGQIISVKACYRSNSQRCILERIQPYRKTEATLGIVAHETFFDFEYKEVFP